MNESEQEEVAPDEKRGSVAEVARLALRLGFTAFGGPAAHIAMLHDEVVTRRKWISEQRFLDMLGATNLIPGPNSTEMVIHVGHIRAGYAGLIAAGVGFIFPAAAIVLALAWLYVNYGTTPTAEWLLYGIKPVIIAIVLQALWGLGRKAVKGSFLGIVGGVVFVLYLVGFDELLLLFAAGLLVAIIQYGRHRFARGDNIEQKLASLPDDKTIVAYCRGPYCVIADDALAVLAANGRRVARLEEGVLEWQQAGHAVSYEF